MTTPAPASAEKSPIQRAVDLYVGLREQRAQHKKVYEDLDGALKKKMEQLETGLLEELKRLGLDNVRVGDTVLYRQMETKPVVEDWKAFGDFILTQGDIGYLQKRISEGSFKEYVQEHGAPPPGVSVMSAHVVRVRKA